MLRLCLDDNRIKEMDRMLAVVVFIYEINDQTYIIIVGRVNI